VRFASSSLGERRLAALVDRDVVLTGTPSGAGYRRAPNVLLRDGDRMVVDMERVGRLENPVVAERA
jgi:2-keto-4-pentenoate hydratase/2-oxohepta-3-ene-1,7-dioic acid hydratase in catechol pathway